MMRNVAVAIGLAAFLVAGQAHAGAAPDLKCRDSKAKEAGKKAAALLKAIGKNISKNPDTKLSANISKAESKFTKGFSKADAKGGCFIEGDSGAIETTINAFVADVEGHINIKCGDDVQAGAEQCDGTEDTLCPGACFPAGDPNECKCDFCGNGIAGALEACDGADDAACAGAGCAGDCTCKLCGNGVLDGSEECDGAFDAACSGLCQVNCTCPVPFCGNGSVEAGEQCDPPGVPGAPCAGGEICNGFCECVTEVGSCTCGGPTPTVYGFTTKVPSTPNCGTTDGIKNPNLECLGLYIGAGSGDLPVPAPIPDEAATLYNASSCDGTGIALTPRTEADVGSQLHCSEGPHPCSATSTTCLCSEDQKVTCTADSDCPATQTCIAECLFGAPLPIINRALIPLSTCLIHTFNADAVGGLDCGSGRSLINQPLNSRVHLNVVAGDHSPTVPGYQPCPICVGGILGVPGSGTCEGGPKNGGPCMPGSTPYDTVKCCTPAVITSAICTTDADCGLGQTCTAGCSGYPTSHDCPPDPIADIGVIPVPLVLTSGVSSESDPAGDICGWCRDVDPGPGLGDTGTKCFEGDPRVATALCPDSASITCTQADQSECGDAVPCRTDVDCVAPYEACQQQNPGAFRDPIVTDITLTGSDAGSLTDYAAHASTIVSAFCIQPSFTAAIDASSDLGGPGALSLTGESQIFSPSGAFIEMTPELLD